MKIGLHWCRRDLRVIDNQALQLAAEENDVVWSVFIFDPVILKSGYTGGPQVHFMLDCLQSLSKNLEALGGKLIVRHGEILTELREVVRESGARAIYFNRDYEPYARRRDENVSLELEKQGLVVKSCKDSVLLEPEEISKEDGSPYVVFTPYARAWRSKVQVECLGKSQLKVSGATKPKSLEVPSVKELGFTTKAEVPEGGERAAQQRLKLFVSGPLAQYKSRRDFPRTEGTSRLSPDLRFGTLSPRQIYRAVTQAMQDNPGAQAEMETFINELIWREFYQSILWHFPHVAKGCFKKACDDLAWENNEGYFQAWCEGKTGFPIVDAGMRQLNQTGWMHNRLRMIVASFLTKDLFIDWKWGEKYFMERLVDGEMAANNGGWQWSASTGTDAQPYFRIFNPTSQAEKFDPEGQFIERYVPEVNSRTYPPPIVDHSVQRVKAMKIFKDLG